MVQFLFPSVTLESFYWHWKRLENEMSYEESGEYGKSGKLAKTSHFRK